MQKITTFKEAVHYIISHIPRNTVYTYPGQQGVDRVKYALSLVGSPQEKLKVIHIAGTSGKGSTSYLTSLLLQSGGFSTGLYIKPHIKDIRERFQINLSLIAENKFIQYLNELVPVFEQVAQSKYGILTYFEINSILAFYIFEKEKVEYAVIETGLGGLYDGTNVVDNKEKFFILTSIGFDHTQILGNTYREIAEQKAGIIQPGNQGISIQQHADAEKVISSYVKRQQAHISWIKHDENISDVLVSINKTQFTYRFEDMVLKDLSLGLIGSYQAENAALALTTIYLLAKRENFAIKEEQIRKALSKANLPGRLEIKRIDKKTLIIDGAHNPQKMDAFLGNLSNLFPNRKFHFLISFKKGKDIDVMLKQIIALAKHITVSIFYTDAQEMIVESEELSSIKEIFESKGFTDYSLETDYTKAFKDSLASTNDILIITGSLYFIGEIYPLIDL